MPAYVYMPVIYLILGFGIITLLLSPFGGIIRTAGNLLFTDVNADASLVKGKGFIEPEVKTVEEQNQKIPENTLYYEDIHWPEYGDQYGKLSCDRLGLESFVYWGDSPELLREGSGTFMGSGIPGANRTMLIAGHNTRELAVVQNAQAGDIITFTTTYGIHEYEVTGTKILRYDDRSAFDLSKKEEELVLYTCYPFTGLSAKTDRLFIYGKRTAGPDLVNKE